MGDHLDISYNIFLLLIMGIALQNELDNLRAQLSQKGELTRDKGPWKALTWILEGGVLERRLPTFCQSHRLSLIYMSKSLVSSCD
jgi:hypothetical protein